MLFVKPLFCIYHLQYNQLYLDDELLLYIFTSFLLRIF